MACNLCVYVYDLFLFICTLIATEDLVKGLIVISFSGVLFQKSIHYDSNSCISDCIVTFCAFVISNGDLMKVLLIIWITYQNPYNYICKAKSAILSDTEIKDELYKGVIIEPFNMNQLSPSSYDVTLAEEYWEPVDKQELPDYISPNIGKCLAKYWGADKGSCLIAKTIDNQTEADELQLNVGDQYIRIKPGHVILACTNEFIGGQGNITTMLKGRSTMGRCSISLCKDAGMGDPGYINRWTLEIENHAQCDVIIPVGERVAQIIFMRTGHVSVPYFKGNHHYQSTDNLDDLIDNWNPYMMLPSSARQYIESNNNTK